MIRFINNRLISRRHLLGILTPLFLLGIAGYAFHYYFFRVSTKTNFQAFYKEFSIQKLRITSAEIDDVLNGNSTSTFVRMCVDAAFVRFALDHSSGGLFDHFMGSYQEGLWEVPPTDTWRKLFVKHQTDWKEARAQFLSAREQVAEPKLSSSPRDQLAILFTNTTTPMLGTAVEITAALSKETLDAPVEYVWIIEGRESIPRAAYWKKVAGHSSSVATLELDFSLDFAWFETVAPITAIVIRSPGLRAAQVKSVMFTDKDR